MLLVPSQVDPSPLWDTLEIIGDRFVLQSLKTSSILTTISSILSSSPAAAKPFRILCKVGPLRLLLIATASTPEEIRANARWIEANLLAQISLLQTHIEVENCVREKLEEHLGASPADASLNGDESSPVANSADEKTRLANESYHSHFDRVPPSEELIQYYPAAYEKPTRQGWLYISRNFLAFYSLIMGAETKVLFELKDVEDIAKLNSKAGMVADSIAVTTMNKTRHFFTNLMSRDECFDLIRSLTKNAVSKMLHTTGSGTSPSSTAPPPLPTAETLEELTRNQGSERLERLEPTLTWHLAPYAFPPCPRFPRVALLLALRQHPATKNFRAAFSLPDNDTLLDATYANVQLLPSTPQIHGRLFLSSCSFLCFISSTRYLLTFNTPLFCVKKVERLQLATPTVKMTLWHGQEVTVQLLCEGKRADRYCEQLRAQVEKVVPLMKLVKPFVKSLPSEELVRSGTIDTCSATSTQTGLGATF
ncbi:TBC1 domain member 9, partial [Gonapodya sp. JEL0774]